MFEDDKSFHLFSFRIFYKRTLFNNSFLKAGFGVSKKKFKKATDRNRIKRLMRESYRLQKNDLAGYLEANNKCLAIFFIYTGNVLPSYAYIFEKIKAALKILEKIANENDDSNP